MNPENFYLEQIQSFEKKSLLRSLQNVQSSSGLKIQLEGKSLWNFTSNNYLDLVDHPQIKEASILATEKWGNGSGGSRLLGGSLQIHADFEEFWAQRSRKEAALLFNSGYAANHGILWPWGVKMWFFTPIFTLMAV
jgi:7-keto-8-aminopelargonate synthetase-like enzyme